MMKSSCNVQPTKTAKTQIPLGLLSPDSDNSVSDRCGAKASGFTLIELMIALALGVFLLGGIAVFFASTRAAYSDVEQLSRIQESLRFVTDVVVRDARNAAFRDQLGLFGIEFSEISAEFAAIADNGRTLSVQYAGLGSCTEEFDDVRLVRNTYFVQDGSLRCTGLSQEWDPDAGNGALVDIGSRTEPLATGLESVSFRFVNSSGDTLATTCGFNDSASLATACTGLVMTLTFQGLQGQGGRSVELRSSFRNVILNQIFE